MNDFPRPEEQLASLSSAVLLLGPGLIIRSVNPAAEQLVGMGAKRMVGKNLADIAEFEEDRFNDWLARGDSQISALSVKTRFAGQGEYKLDLILSPVVGHTGWQMLAMHNISATDTLGDGDEPPEIHDDDGEDGAELDQHLEDTARAVEAQEVFGQQQVAGRGNRQEFCQSFEDAEQEGHKKTLIAVHLISYPSGNGAGGRMRPRCLRARHANQPVARRKRTASPKRRRVQGS